MIEIDFDAFFVGEVRIILVVVVLLENRDAFLRKRLDDAARDRGLARPGAAADADNQCPLLRRSDRLLRSGGALDSRPSPKRAPFLR
jgi:hypothetical protein